MRVQDEHVLGEIDDDGHPDRCFRRYRYVCRCGKAGSWRPLALAIGEHSLHRGEVAVSSEVPEVPEVPEVQR